MTSLYSLFTIIPVLLGGFYFYVHQRTYGHLKITTSSVAYNRTKYSNILDWDSHSFIINQKPTQIYSGEFHYWRVPDRERWEPILKQYKSAGFNTIRIYFHWAYHSPDEGIYRFDGNRDVDYLLTLCERLGLYVLAAPGPYICAETSGGGFPSWLVAKRHLRIRHNYIMLWRVYDPEYAAYEVQWLEHILPIIAKHQITNGEGGCVLALQIENELFETMANLLPVGLHDQMRVLAKAARDIGITLPLFSNDGFEEAGWVPRPELDQKKKRYWQKDKFGLDLYGFDKYVIFAPTSSPKSWLINSGVSVASWEEWNPKNIEHSMDKLEKTVRGFGGGAKESPIFIPELQGGWFNHYQLQHTYDQIYDYYGDEYTKLIIESALAQGITATNLYIIYGGTNWGTLGDPDVYTSYDYSGCIREFGMLSSRGRNVRKTILLTQSFDPYFTRTERVTEPNIKSSIPHTLNLQRISVKTDQAVTFSFFRNFDRKKRDTFDVTVHDGSNIFKMACYLPYKTSFIAVGNYTAANGAHLIFSTLPILTKLSHGSHEVWLVESNTIGSMAFASTRLLHPTGPITILKVQDRHLKLETDRGILYIINLSPTEASTLFRDRDTIAWGADYFFLSGDHLEVYHRGDERSSWLVQFGPAGPDWSPTDLPFLYRHDYSSDLIGPVSIRLEGWETREIKYDQMEWKKTEKLEMLDHHYLSGHVLYRQTLKARSPRQLKLKLNVRHRATVLLNGRVVGGHTTYSRQLFMPGAKIGPDPTFLGSQSYMLELAEENELIIVVESFGLSRQAFIMNDVRNPRGILQVEGPKGEWEVAGVDVRQLQNVFSSTGFPDENCQEGWEKVSGLSSISEPRWFRCRFDHEHLTVPLRLHLDGDWSGMVVLNDVLIARFYGNGDGPQRDFYLPAGLVRSKANQLKILAYSWNGPVDPEIYIAGWPVLPDSGNLITHQLGLDHKPEEYVLYKEVLNLN